MSCPRNWKLGSWLDINQKCVKLKCQRKKVGHLIGKLSKECGQWNCQMCFHLVKKWKWKCSLKIIQSVKSVFTLCLARSERSPAAAERKKKIWTIHAINSGFYLLTRNVDIGVLERMLLWMNMNVKQGSTCIEEGDNSVTSGLCFHSARVGLWISSTTQPRICCNI